MWSCDWRRKGETKPQPSQPRRAGRATTVSSVAASVSGPREATLGPRLRPVACKWHPSVRAVDVSQHLDSRGAARLLAGARGPSPDSLTAPKPPSRLDRAPAKPVARRSQPRRGARRAGLGSEKRDVECRRARHWAGTWLVGNNGAVPPCLRARSPCLGDVEASRLRDVDSLLKPSHAVLVRGLALETPCAWARV